MRPNIEEQLMSDPESHFQDSWGTRTVWRCAFIRLSIQILILAALAARPAASQDAGPQIKAEVERLQQSIQERPVVFPDFPKAPEYINDSLKEALAAQSAGKIYISLEALVRAEDLLQGVRVMVDKADAVKSRLPAYEAEWNKASLDLTALDRQARERLEEFARRDPGAVRDGAGQGDSVARRRPRFCGLDGTEKWADLYGPGTRRN
jgi:hypothetical protein